jgi:hypothetical protein
VFSGGWDFLESKYIYIYIYIRVINSEEINIEEILIDDFSKNIEYWKILKVKKNQIYHNSFNLFKTNFTIKTKK